MKEWNGVAKETENTYVFPSCPVGEKKCTMVPRDGDVQSSWLSIFLFLAFSFY